MIRFIGLALAVTLAAPMSARGADLGDAAGPPGYRSPASYQARFAGPYPLSWRARKIRRADRCWRGCLAEAGRDFHACLRVHRPTVCVQWNGSANLHCLNECRLSGGPWVTLAE
jgi:hypothetical protein